MGRTRKTGAPGPVAGGPLVPALAPVIVLIGTFATFFPALSNGFVNWDDDRNFLMNPLYRGLGWSQIRWMFTTFHLGPYQPLSWMTLGLDYAIWGMNPFGYHLTSVLLHCANACLFYFLTLRLLELAHRGGPAFAAHRYLAAAAGAFFFSLHPLRAESVAWVTERRDVLSGFFILLAVLAYSRAFTRNDVEALGHVSTLSREARGKGGSSRAWTAASLVLFALSLISKATGMTLPIVLLALDFYPLRRFGDPQRGRAPGNVDEPDRARRSSSLGASGTSGGSGSGGSDSGGSGGPSRSRGSSVPSGSSGAGRTRLSTGSSGAGESGRPNSAASRQVWIEKIPFFALSIAAGAAAAVGQARLGILAPVEHQSFFLRVARSAYGMVFYLGKTLFPAHLSNLYEVPFRLNPWDPRFLLSGALILAVTVAVVAARRNWPAGLVCWISYAALMLPVSGIGHGGGQILADRYTYLPCLAWAVLAAGGVQAAATEARRSPLAGRLTASHGRTALLAILVLAVLVPLGISASRQCQVWRSSETLWRHAFDLHPVTRLEAAGSAQSLIEVARYKETLETLGEKSAYWAICYGLGVAVQEQQRFDEAIALYRRALEVNPRNAEVQNNWGTALGALGRNDEAIGHYREALRLNPSYAKAHFNLGSALSRQGKLDEAVAELKASIAVDSESAETFYNLGLALYNQGKLVEALDAYRQALRIDPRSAQTCNNLAVVLSRQGKLTEAVAMYREALAIDPGHREAQRNLDQALKLLGAGQ